MLDINVGELRRYLDKKGAKWAALEGLSDQDPLPRFYKGVVKEKIWLVPDVGSTDLEEKIKEVTTNPWLMHRRISGGAEASDIPEPGWVPPYSTPYSSGLPRKVDWRNRFGHNWITAIKDQGKCGACAAFSTAGLVESMVRIEHSVWCVRSEGDLRRGMQKPCEIGQNEGITLDWIHKNGIVDPDCCPYSEDDKPWTYTTDRSGRTCNYRELTAIGYWPPPTDATVLAHQEKVNIANTREWLDKIGPLTCTFDFWNDFYFYGIFEGVYRKSDRILGFWPNSTDGSTHSVLIVGYDDDHACWIVKNSWGTGWGDDGYGLIGVGECNIDIYPKYGISGTRPDPWTKRRLHGGNILETSNGLSHRDFEMLATSGNHIRHYWRDNYSRNLEWHKGEIFADDADITKSQPILLNTTHNRNLECVYLNIANRLRRWIYDANQQQWLDKGTFGPSELLGQPGFIQSGYGHPGHLEVVARTMDGKIRHLWCEAEDGNWQEHHPFAQNVRNCGGRSFIQSQSGSLGNFELVCVLNNAGREMQHWCHDTNQGFVWRQEATFGTCTQGSPCMIQSSFGATNAEEPGNFELCTVNINQVEHWWLNRNDQTWRKSTSFGHDVLEVLGLMQGSFGFNLEVIVLDTNYMLQHYWRDNNGWHEGEIIGSIQ